MPSTAQVAQLSKFYVSGTPGTAITITAITKAVAAVVTAVNTLVVGDVVLFGAVTGMPEINGLLGIVTVATWFELHGRHRLVRLRHRRHDRHRQPADLLEGRQRPGLHPGRRQRDGDRRHQHGLTAKEKRQGCRTTAITR
jgi:hypothetical protein